MAEDINTSGIINKWGVDENERVIGTLVQKKEQNCLCSSNVYATWGIGGGAALYRERGW
jgi:hypothetical protein